jgi:hypothetical protein
MKTFRYLLVFITTYFFLGTLVWILVADKMSWREVMTFGVMLFLGFLASFFITVCYAVEQDNKAHN